ncbi:hypothetical protein GCM10010365_16100 [Streptomyces poonensis]|uniref:Beta-galactosidase trimerisation domain-containing protein n=1 Tax=Streptomyces poonensis TaxID=68255 RepID=A0A918UEY3_9ACTN|nr:beta-galactosidase trimerization domain-containing protein [Streptomyces poonensis]GGY98317.1 hypothetical protein GCM10010365_16100 [Streptomyces poonensis]
MLPHGGESTRGWQQVRALGNELTALDEVVTGVTTAQVAIVWDWENWWAVEGCYHPLDSYSYQEVVSSHYRALWHAHVAVDVVCLDDDLSRHRVLVVPNQYLLSEAQREAVDAFVRAGGHVLVSYFSGIVDENDRVHANGHPGGLRDVIGGHLRELSPLAPGTTAGVRGVVGSLLGEDFTPGPRPGRTTWPPRPGGPRPPTPTVTSRAARPCSTMRSARGRPSTWAPASKRMLWNRSSARSSTGRASSRCMRCHGASR